MKKGMSGLFTAMLAIGSMGGMGISSPLVREDSYRLKRKVVKLGNYKHIGDIPKGCKLFNEEIIAEKDGIAMTIRVDIVCGTEKARLKKYIKYINEVYEYVRNSTMKEIKESGAFIIYDLENKKLDCDSK